MPSSPLIALLATAGLLTAAPVQDPFPEQAGKVAARSCPEGPLSSGGIPQGREYLRSVMKCLDKSWAAYARRAGHSIGRPTVLYYDEPRRTVCGMPWPEHAAAFYCTERATLVFPLTGTWIEGRDDLYPMKVAAHEYGHHVQSAFGVRKAYERRARSTGDRRGELKRRYELQADCLAGVFMGSVWTSLGRAQRDWAALLDAVRASGDEGGERTHGKGASRVAWLQRGFRTLSPAVCDTWSAPAAKVS